LLHLRWLRNDRRNREWPRDQRRRALVVVLVASMAPLASWAGDLDLCRGLKAERDRLAAEAMRAEIALVRRYRERLCPVLEQQAQAANANSQVASATGPTANATGPTANANSQAAKATGQPFQSFDYAAFIRCRHQAEQMLEHNHRLLYRNHQGFTFYTAAGASLARQADQVRQQLASRDCP